MRLVGFLPSLLLPLRTAAVVPTAGRLVVGRDTYDVMCLTGHDLIIPYTGVLLLYPVTTETVDLTSFASTTLLYASCLISYYMICMLYLY